MRSMFKRNLATSGVPFTIRRTNQPVKGILNYSTEKPCIYLPLDCNIQSGDIVINSIGQDLHITEIQPNQNYLVCFYQPESTFQKSANNSTTFNINADKIESSIIETQNCASINLDLQIQNMKSDISESQSSDKEELMEIISLLENMKSSNEPIQKGILSKFSSVMERNSWITGSVAGFLLNLLRTP